MSCREESVKRYWGLLWAYSGCYATSMLPGRSSSAGWPSSRQSRLSPSVDSTGRRSLCQSCRALGPWGTNAYVLVCPVTSESVLIDPAGEPETLLSMLGDSTPVAILITHAHPDPVAALEAIRGALPAPACAA